MRVWTYVCVWINIRDIKNNMFGSKTFQIISCWDDGGVWWGSGGVMMHYADYGMSVCNMYFLFHFP